MTDKENFIVEQTKLNFYIKLEAKLELIVSGELELLDYVQEVYNKKQLKEEQVTDLAIELNLSDEEWQKFSDKNI